MKDRTLLMIPGPIEFEPAVLAAVGAPTTSHVAPNFIEVFGQALERMREVFQSPDGQPIILAGSGTLAMDTVGANLIEPGDRALVVSTGYFGERFAALLTRYGAEVTQVKAPVGCDGAPIEAERALRNGTYKLMAMTHVDTSTGVIDDVKALAAVGREYGTMVVVDGVCSVAGEELRMAEWGVDAVLTASQKAIGVPPGLALVMAGPRAIEAFKKRKTPVANYYADWANWLPVMQAYEARQVANFGTPAVNLVWGLNASLGQIVAEGMEARWARHRTVGRAMQAAIAALSLDQVPAGPDCAAHTMTAPRYPAGVKGPEFLGRVAKAGVALAGGLHPEIKTQYFRVGHMGAVSQGDILATLGAIEAGLAGCGYDFEHGAGVAAAAAVLEGQA